MRKNILNKTVSVLAAFVMLVSPISALGETDISAENTGNTEVAESTENTEVLGHYEMNVLNSLGIVNFTEAKLTQNVTNEEFAGAAALVGSVLGIKPILRGDETGHIVSCGKVRGNKKAYAELADYFNKRALDKTARIGIAHADNREGTDYLLGLLRERGFTGECLEVYYEPVTGAHVGPGTVALFFYGTEK